MAAAKYRLDNLVAVVDCNKLQVDGPVIMPMAPLGAKWQAFGWEVIEIDGHDMKEIFTAFHQARPCPDKPVCIERFTN